MAQKEGNHYIEEQIINLDIVGNVDDKEIKIIQENFIYYYKEFIATALQKAFDDLVPPDIHLQIDSLDLDLGTLKFEKSGDLAKQIQRKIKDIVERVVRAKIINLRQQAPKSQATGRKQPLSQMGIFEHFLTKGYYPNWAGKETGSVVELLDQLLKKNKKGVVQRIVRLKKNKKVLERLYQQFTVEQLEQIFEALYGSAAQLAYKQIKILKKRFGTASQKAIISAAIDYVLEESSNTKIAEYKEREFARRVLEGVQKRRGTKKTDSKVRAGYEGQYSDLQIIEYFLEYGAIPAWADVGSKTSLQELMNTLLQTKVASLQRLLERHIQTPNFIQRLIFQFSDQQIFQLLAPTPTENITFIKDTLEALSFVSTSRQAIQQRLSATAVRNLVFSEVLEYFFLQKKTKFIKKTVLNNILQRLVVPSKTEHATLVRELYKSVRRRSNRASNLQKDIEATQIDVSKLSKEQLAILNIDVEKLSEEQLKALSIDLSQLSEEQLKALNIDTTKLSKEQLKALSFDLSQLSEEQLKALNIDTTRKPKSTSPSFSSNIRQVLEQLDSKLQQKIQEERQEVRETRRQYKKVQQQFEKLLEKQREGTLSVAQSVQLRQLAQQVEQLEQTLMDLEDEDQPLYIEQVVQQRQQLQNQLRQAQDSEQEKLTRRLANTNKELKKLRANLEKDVQKALQEQEKLREKSGSIAQQQLQRIANRLNKYYRAVKTVLSQLTTDQTETTVFLTNINRALREKISADEKKQLRQERSRLQKQLVELNESIEALQAQEKTIEEALKNSKTLLKQNEGDEEDETISATGTSKLDALIFMLQYGATPWWAEDLPRQSIEELFLEFADKAPQKLLKAFQHIGQYPVVWQRVLNQLSVSAIRTVISKVYPTSSKVIFEQANMLKTIHFAQGFERLKSVDAKLFEWGVIVEYLFTNRQGFNPQDFVKEVILQTARVHLLSPTQLLQMTTNIAKNQKEELGDFIHWNANVSEDRSVAVLERELAAFQRDQKAKEEGTFLDNEQKLELLVEFLSAGRFTERAKALKLTTQKQFEDILIEQIQENKQQTKQVLFNIIRLSHARSFIINNMDESFFWEIVFLLKPKATLTAKRHFKDLKPLVSDKNLVLAKDVLFNVFINNPTAEFKIIDFVRSFVIATQQATGRELLGILTDWKRQLKSRGNSLNSSMLLSILLLEVDALKVEQKQAQDMDLKASLNEQVNFSTKEYTDYSVALVAVLAQETAELQSMEEKNYRYKELKELIEKNQAELSSIEAKLNEGKLDSLEKLELQRKLVQYQARLNWLELHRPPLLRRIEHTIQQLKQSIEVLQEEVNAIERSGTTLEAITPEEEFELSLIERQAQFLEFLEKQNPVAIDLLEPLLEALKEDDQQHALFFRDIQRLAASLREERFRQAITEIMERMLPSITPLEELQRNPELDERQAAILQNFNQQAPVMLWQAWDELETYFKENPEAFTPARMQLQEEIRKAIRRREEQNFRSYVSNLRLMQQNLMRQLDQANSLEALDEVQQQIEVIWEQQRRQVEELLSVARDDKARNDYKRLKRNIEHVFVRIQNTRIRRANAIRSNQENDPKALLTSQIAEVEILEEELNQIVIEIEDKEDPKPKPQQPPKRKRAKEAPKPKPIEEPLQVYNAGMVLLAPYISRLFSMLGYYKKREWVDINAQYKAIHILQYLVTGKTEAPENELILNKVMCGFPVAEPVPFGIEFEPQELQFAESLLVGVIKNWPKMNKLVPNSLRGSFLIREGTLKESEAKWELKVQKRPFDILLKTIPWGYNFLRFPWNDYFITVEWKLL